LHWPAARPARLAGTTGRGGNQRQCNGDLHARRRPQCAHADACAGGAGRPWTTQTMAANAPKDNQNPAAVTATDRRCRRRSPPEPARRQASRDCARAMQPRPRPASAPSRRGRISPCGYWRNECNTHGGTGKEHRPRRQRRLPLQHADADHECGKRRDWPRSAVGATNGARRGRLRSRYCGWHAPGSAVRRLAACTAPRRCVRGLPAQCAPRRGRAPPLGAMYGASVSSTSVCSGRPRRAWYPLRTTVGQRTPESELEATRNDWSACCVLPLNA